MFVDYVKTQFPLEYSNNSMISQELYLDRVGVSYNKQFFIFVFHTQIKKKDEISRVLVYLGKTALIFLQSITFKYSDNLPR